MMGQIRGRMGANGAYIRTMEPDEQSPQTSEETSKPQSLADSLNSPEGQASIMRIIKEQNSRPPYVPKKDWSKPDSLVEWMNSPESQAGLKKITEEQNNRPPYVPKRDWSKP